MEAFASLKKFVRDPALIDRAKMIARAARVDRCQAVFAKTLGFGPAPIHRGRGASRYRALALALMQSITSCSTQATAFAEMR